MYTFKHVYNFKAILFSFDFFLIILKIVSNLKITLHAKFPLKSYGTATWTFPSDVVTLFSGQIYTITTGQGAVRTICIVSTHFYEIYKWLIWINRVEEYITLFICTICTMLQCIFSVFKNICCMEMLTLNIRL